MKHVYNESVDVIEKYAVHFDTESHRNTVSGYGRYDIKRPRSMETRSLDTRKIDVKIHTAMLWVGPCIYIPCEILNGALANIYSYIQNTITHTVKFWKIFNLRVRRCCLDGPASGILLAGVGRPIHSQRAIGWGFPVKNDSMVSSR